MLSREKEKLLKTLECYAKCTGQDVAALMVYANHRNGCTKVIDPPVMNIEPKA